ncbi:hypothetical protein (nucleomorph) [Guillardia theta]|uniref:Uncharacterized protein n=1 Tax=Guillardia theta TaxID=55529 RepID=Q98SA2_GUITH|nr:hypothetical protein GTHECHR3037 [Guillardia theta]AAK39681.1 hypothetical protein [Guillardia theta]
MYLSFNIARSVYESLIKEFESLIQPWKICCNEGALIQNFGVESNQLCSKFIKEFENNLKLFENDPSYKTFFSLFLNYLHSEIEGLFYKQLSRLKELAFNSFKESLSPIQITEKVERDVKLAIKAAENYFTTKAEILRGTKFSKDFSYSNEKKELIKAIRELATERLQMARLQGIYQKKNKNPVSISFHYLHPSPFGKDARFEHFSFNDSFDFDSNTKASLMRQFVENNNNSKKIKNNSLNQSQSTDNFVYNLNASKLFNND